MLKGPIFSLNSTHHRFWTNFEWKRTVTLGELDDITQNVAIDYDIMQNPTILNRMPR